MSFAWLLETRSIVGVTAGCTVLGAIYSMTETESSLRETLKSPGDLRLSAEWWSDKWNMGQTGWRASDGNWEQMLKRSEECLKLQSSDERLLPPPPQAEALVPLCGDSGVVPYLVRQGYRVTCVEWSGKAVAKMEERVKEELGDVDGAVEKVNLVSADFFKTNLPAGSFHLVFDRRAFVDLDPIQREQYAKRIASAVRPGGVLCLEGRVRPRGYSGPLQGWSPPSAPPHSRHNKPSNPQCGPPHNSPPEAVSKLFPDWEFVADKPVVTGELPAHLPYSAFLRKPLTA